MTADRCVPGKRLRNWHRRHGQSMPLRAFVRGVAAGADLGVPFTNDGQRSDGARVAKAWLKSKRAAIVLSALALFLAAAPAHADCGEERAAIKLGTDVDARTVALAPVDLNIADLTQLTAPRHPPMARRVAAERTVYRVAATIIGYKLEGDGDFHIVIADDLGNTMIVEIPEPGCAKPGAWGDRVAAARASFLKLLAAQHLPRPGAHMHHAHIAATVTGLGFWDKIHGQAGVARNGIELHPVLAIEAGGGS